MGRTENALQKLPRSRDELVVVFHRNAMEALQHVGRSMGKYFVFRALDIHFQEADLVRLSKIKDAGEWDNGRAMGLKAIVIAISISATLRPYMEHMIERTRAHRLHSPCAE